MVNRRRFCERAGWMAAGFGGLGSMLLTSRVAEARPLDDVRERLLDALPSRRHAVSVGEARLAELAERPDPSALTANVIEALNLSPAELRRTSPANLRALLKARNASDFADNRTARLGGWVLGATETDLFCLAALTPA